MDVASDNLPDDVETLRAMVLAERAKLVTTEALQAHGSPSITLDVYSHLFKPTDRGAAAVFDKAFGGLQTE